MECELLSVGIDIGTTTTQVIFSRLVIENAAGAMSLPEWKAIQKEILYRSDIHLTPLRNGQIDLAALQEIVAKEYRNGGFVRDDIHTGAIIITGETARKENAPPVLECLAEYAGDFVVSAAGPDLEAVLAGYGAGIAEMSRTISDPVINFDIGGGTTNAAIFFNGEVMDSYALDIGGRLVHWDERSYVDYLSPRIAPLISELGLALTVGSPASLPEIQCLCQRFAAMFLELLSLRPLASCTRSLWIGHDAAVGFVPVVSFSGGVADSIYEPPKIHDLKDLPFNDIGPLLGPCIREVIATSPVRLIKPRETMRATVVGAGSHTVQISGVTIACDESILPLRNMPVIQPFLPKEPEDYGILAEKIRRKRAFYPEQVVAIAMRGPKPPRLSEVRQIASQILAGLEGYEHPIVVILEQDCAKAIGQMLLTSLLPHVRPVVCLDRIKVKGGDYVDIGVPIAGLIPVVIKTLVFHA
jgi:ethanolamine utilization protein EutA